MARRPVPIQLTDVAPTEAAQERPQGGWLLDHTAQNPGRPAGAQRVGVVDAVAASQRSRHQRQHLVAGVGSAWGATPGRDAGQPVRAGPDAGPAWLAGSAQHWPPGGGRQRRFGCGRGGHLVASFGCSLFLVGFLSRNPLSQMHRSTFLPLQHAATLISSVDWGLGFPDVLDIERNRHVLKHISEINGRPVPFPTLALFYVGEAGMSGQTGELYCSGYTNAGYSGGVLAFPVHGTRQWSLAGIVTGYPRMWRPIQLPEGSLLAIDGSPKSRDHLGLIKAVTMNEVEAIVREGRCRSK